MASRVASRRLFSSTVRRFQEHEKQELKKETKKNPELMVRHNHPDIPFAVHVHLRRFTKVESLRRFSEVSWLLPLPELVSTLVRTKSPTGNDSDVSSDIAIVQ